jgi:hypothetical protein
MRGYYGHFVLRARARFCVRPVNADATATREDLRVNLVLLQLRSSVMTRSLRVQP